MFILSEGLFPIFLLLLPNGRPTEYSPEHELRHLQTKHAAGPEKRKYSLQTHVLSWTVIRGAVAAISVVLLGTSMSPILVTFLERNAGIGRIL